MDELGTLDKMLEGASKNPVYAGLLIFLGILVLVWQLRVMMNKTSSVSEKAIALGDKLAEGLGGSFGRLAAALEKRNEADEAKTASLNQALAQAAIRDVTLAEGLNRVSQDSRQFWETMQKVLGETTQKITNIQEGQQVLIAKGGEMQELISNGDEKLVSHLQKLIEELGKLRSDFNSNMGKIEAPLVGMLDLVQAADKQTPPPNPLPPDGGGGNKNILVLEPSLV